jgi:hypothetical protein
MTLNSQKPEAHDLVNLDSFDLAFLRLTGNVCFVPLDHFIVNVLKASKDTIMWGPEAKLLGVILRKAWQKHGGEVEKQIRSAFDLRGGLSVDRKKAAKALKRLQSIAAKAAKTAKPKVREILQIAQDRSRRRFIKQIKSLKKADP